MVKVKIYCRCQNGCQHSARCRKFANDYRIPVEHSEYSSGQKIFEEIGEPASPVLVIGEKKIVGFSPRHIKKALQEELAKESKEGRISNKEIKRGRLPKIDAEEITEVPLSLYKGEVVDKFVNIARSKIGDSNKQDISPVLKELYNEYPDIPKDKIKSWIQPVTTDDNNITKTTIDNCNIQRFIK